MLPRFEYLFSEVGIGLRRNLLMTIATIITVTVTVTMVGAGWLVQRQVNLAQRVLYAEVEVSIFLEDSITPEQLQSLEQDLRAQSVVDDVIYESKDDAYANAQQIYANDPVILQDIGPEVLPASFRVKLTNPEEFDVIASLFEGRPGIDQIRDQSNLLDDFFSIMGVIREFATSAAFLVALAAIALVATTIRLTAFARREQTAIMKLVGATNWYIRLPFVLEGVITSASGALLAIVFLVSGIRFRVAGIRETIGFIPFIGIRDVLIISPWLLLGAVLVGAVVSVVALRRFLAV